MPIPDPFSYSARWGSVGLDCAYCSHFRGPESWPDERRVSRCARHELPLAIELRGNGYKESEWLCREFTHSGDPGASREALERFAILHKSLEPLVLYRLYAKDRNLVEIPFDEVRRAAG